MKSALVGFLFIGGVASVAVALWWVSPAAGLGFVGVALLVCAFGIAKK